MPPAARLTDAHTCSHGGGAVASGGEPTVLIGGKPAARRGDRALCGSPMDPISGGEPSVLIGGAMAARMGDATAHGGLVTGGDLSVWIGRNRPCDCLKHAARRGKGLVTGDARARSMTDRERIDEALARVEASRFAATPEGQRVVERLREMHHEGKISIGPLEEDYNAQFNSNTNELVISDRHRNEPDYLASRLSHEGTHSVDRLDYPEVIDGSVDGELRARLNQLEFYEEQRAGGYRDRDLEDQRIAHRRDQRQPDSDDEHMRELIRAAEQDNPRFTEHRVSAGAPGGAR